MDTTKQIITVTQPKPRSQVLSRVLSGRKGGRMKGPRDRDRNSEKRELRRMVSE